VIVSGELVDDGRSGPCTPFISETASSKSLQLCQEARALPRQPSKDDLDGVDESQ
jgi:hypothetical protein